MGARVLALVGTCCAALALAPAIAEAAHTRIEVNSFGSFSNPTGVAIDQETGDVYVADTANHRIEKYSEAGTFLLAFGKDVGGSGIDTCTSSCQPGTAGSSPGAFDGSFERLGGNNELIPEERLFLAVDNDPLSPSHHDVYVGDPGDKFVSKFDENGNLVATWGNNGSGGSANGQLAGDGSEAFLGLTGIAVDSAGNLDVLAAFRNPSGNHEVLQEKLFRFAESGTLSAKFALEGFFPIPIGLGVDPAGDFFTATEGGVIEKLSSSGSGIGRVSPNNFAPLPYPIASAFSVDPSHGDLYVASAEALDASPGTFGTRRVERRAVDHYAFNGSGEVIEPDGSACALGINGCQPTDSARLPFAPAGVDVDAASGDVYLADPAGGEVRVYEEVPIPDVTAEAATEVTGTAATLNGTVDTAGTETATALTGCDFEYLSAAQMEENESEGKDPFAGASEAQCEPPFGSIADDDSPHPVKATISQLQPGTLYRYRLVAENQYAPNHSAALTLETAPPPSVELEQAKEITASSATLTAKVNPNGLATSCEIEWGAAEEPFHESPYDHAEPCQPAAVGNGASSVPVSLALAGLSADTTYHWRLVARNENGTTISPEHTFVFLTEATPEPEAPCGNEALRDENGSAALPDCRAYEMVSPLRKNGSLIGAVSFLGGSPKVAADGEQVIAPVLQCFADAGSCNAQHGNGIGSPYEFSRTGSGWATTPLAPPATEYPVNTPWDFSASTGTALFSMPTPPFGENDFYLRDTQGSFLHIGPITPPSLGRQEGESQGGRLAGRADADTADFSHRVWESSRLHWPFDETEVNGASVYEYAGLGNAQPFLVGVSGGPGSNSLISTCGTALGNSHGHPGSVMSADGRTVFFSTGPCSTGSGANAGTPVPATTIYARVDGELPGAETVSVSDPVPSECGSGSEADEESCREAPPADAYFEGAAADGRAAVFTTTRQLTDDAPEDGHAGDSAVQQGVNACPLAEASGCNLYLYDFAAPAGHHLVDLSAGDASGVGPRVQGVVALSPDGSHVYFVAKGVLAGPNREGTSPRANADNLYVYARGAAHPVFVAILPTTDAGEWTGTPGKPANVTPDGRFLVFPSHGKLTPDDGSRSGAAQIFRYDAEAEALNRLTIGRRGFADNGNRSVPSRCSNDGSCAEDAGIVQALGFERSDPTMSDDGSRVFFTSPLALVPGAPDDRQIREVEGTPAYAQSVYEWQRQGTGGCVSAAGCVSLVSGGHDLTVNNGGGGLCTFSSICLLGSDETGANVFFSTADQLVPGDSDTELDLYDARIGGGFAPPPLAAPCETSEACHGAGTSEGAGSAPTSNSFAGAEEGPKHPRRPACRRHRKHRCKKHRHAHHHRGGRK